MKNLALSLTLMALVAGCDRTAPKPDAHDHGPKTGAQAEPGHEGHDHAKEGHDPGHGGVHVPLSGIRGLGFLLVPEASLAGRWSPAEALCDEAMAGLLSAPVSGIVSAIPGAPGRPVASGAALLLIQSPELARLKADWLGAKARLDRTEAEVAREQRLYDAKAGSRRELEAAQAEAATARADHDAARLALEARGLRPEQAGATLTVRAPRAGVVGTWRVQLGQGVSAGQELGTFQAALAELAQVELALPLPEGWKPGTVAEVRASDGRSWKGRLESAPLALSPETRRVAYRLRLQGRNLPMAGTPLEVQVPLARAIRLPQAALQQLDGVWGVFVREGDQAHFRPVKRGPEVGAEVLVLEGVKPGETLVSEGAYLLKAAHRKSSGAEEAGHVH